MSESTTHLGLMPPYDLIALRESLPPDRRPVTRTYTLRRADAQRQEVEIDFVVHGDEGIAAPWAAHAQPGDILTLSGAGGAYHPDPGRDWHLLAGDESALPAICSALEAPARRGGPGIPVWLLGIRPGRRRVPVREAPADRADLTSHPGRAVRRAAVTIRRP